MDLKSSSSDLTSALTGKIAGIIGWQTGGAPGALTEEEMNTKFYIRGISSSNGASEPLVLIDGVESAIVEKMQGNFRPDEGKIGRLVSRKQGSNRTDIEIGLERNGKVSIGFGNRQEKHAEVDASINHF